MYKLKSHHLNKWHLGLVVTFWILLAYNIALSIAGILPFVNKTTTYQYSVIEYLGYVKVSISFIKYCPQAYMNWSRQSTIGWSIGNVLLDLTGGLLAFGQQALEAYRTGNSSEFTSNIAKLLLSCESVAFDLLFLVQHYILYRGNNVSSEATGYLTLEEQEALEQRTQAQARANVANFVPKGLLNAMTSASTTTTNLTGEGNNNGGDNNGEYQSVDHQTSQSVNLDMDRLGAGGANGVDQRTKLLHQRQDSSSNDTHM